MGRWQDKRLFNTTVLRRWHLKEVLSHSCAEQQWALRDPSLNATYKLVTRLPKVPMLTGIKVPNSSQFNGDNHSRFYLASSFRPQPLPKHSLSPATAQSSFNSLKRCLHQEKLQSKDSKLWYDGALPGNSFRVLNSTWHHTVHRDLKRGILCFIWHLHELQSKQWQEQTPEQC